jgi:hypothetical protein
MTEFLTFDLNQTYAKIKELGEAQAVTNEEAYHELVEGYINERVDLGELDPDQDTEQIINELKSRWENYHDNLVIK